MPSDAVTECGLLAVDCVVVCCCCPCALLQITVFLLLRLRHKLAAKTTALRRLRRRSSGVGAAAAAAAEEVEALKRELARREAEAASDLMAGRQGGGDWLEEAGKVWEGLVETDGVFWFGSFWGTATGAD